MTTFRQIQDEVMQTLQGFGLDQPRVAFLAQDYTASDLTMTVDDTANLGQGIAEIGDELVFIKTVDQSAAAITLSPDGRGYYGTSPAAHGTGARVTYAPVFPRNRVKAAINDIITSCYPTLFGVAQTQFTFTPAITTYALPAEAERIVSVSADLNGPSREQQTVRHYQFNSVAPTDDWDSTNTISLHEAVSPGRTVTVTYLKAPSALSADSDLLTTSGLRDTAKLAIVYGACSQLASFMDTARLPVDTAQADEYDDRNPVGIASRVAGQLYLRYTTELEAERKRLRATTPVTISMRKR